MLDFVRSFFVSCVQIFEAYAVRTLMKFGCDLAENQPQKQVQERLREYISTKGGFPCFLNLFLSFTFYQKKKDILIYTAADSKHQYILKCSENITFCAARPCLMNMKDYLLCPTHLSHIIMDFRKTSLCQEQAFLFLLFVWNTAKALYFPNLYHLYL